MEFKDKFYTIGACTYYVENDEFHLLDVTELRKEVYKILSSNSRGVENSGAIYFRCNSMRA